MEHKIGLVFDGGGGKGAYQVGVWKALKEAGLDKCVTAIAGTSVGGLNAALFVKGDLKLAEKIWTKDISKINTLEIGKGVGELIDQNLGDMSFFSESKIDCFITTTNKGGGRDNGIIDTAVDGKHIKKFVSGKAVYFNMRYIDDKRDALLNASMRKSVLLATSALPVLCRAIKIDGKHYIDGGVMDNSPYYPLLFKKGTDTIIVVHLGTEKAIYDKFGVSDDVSILEIVPSGDTGGFFNGTVNFDTKHAEALMKMGYNDAKGLFALMTDIHEKENRLKENDDDLMPRIEHLSLEDKYRLYNECAFLIHGNHSKINYISEKGFGKTLIRIITSNDGKCKRQILENTAELHCKMLTIMYCLDEEVQNLKQGMRFLLYRSMDTTDILLSMQDSALSMSELLKAVINHIEYSDNFLSEKYPEFKKCDIKAIEQKLDGIKEAINARIEALNAIGEADWKYELARIEAQAKRITQAKENRVLRITTGGSFVLSAGLREPLDVDLTNFKINRNMIPPREVRKLLEDTNCSAVILPESNGAIVQKIVQKTIKTADYFMYLWFINTPLEERAGKCICMIDYYFNDLHLYGYEVSDDGEHYTSIQIGSDKDRQLKKHKAKKIWDETCEKFGENYAQKFVSSDGFYRTFSPSYKPLDNKLEGNEKVNVNFVDPEKWEKQLNEDDGRLFVEFVDKFIDKVYE